MWNSERIWSTSAKFGAELTTAGSLQPKSGFGHAAGVLVRRVTRSRGGSTTARLCANACLPPELRSGTGRRRVGSVKHQQVLRHLSTGNRATTQSKLLGGSRESTTPTAHVKQTALDPRTHAKRDGYQVPPKACQGLPSASVGAQCLATKASRGQCFRMPYKAFQTRHCMGFQ